MPFNGVKRRAETQLTKDNYDDGDKAPEQPKEMERADEETLRKRRIFRRRRGGRLPRKEKEYTEGTFKSVASVDTSSLMQNPLALLMQLGEGAKKQADDREEEEKAAERSADKSGGTWTCKCGHENDEAQECCSECWKVRTDKPKAAATPEKECLPDGKWRCVVCFEVNSKDSRVCTGCCNPRIEEDVPAAPGSKAGEDKDKTEAPAKTEGKEETEAKVPVFAFGVADKAEPEKAGEKTAQSFGIGALPQSEEKSPAFGFDIAPQPEKTEEKPVFGFGIAPQPEKDKTESKTTAPAFGFSVAPQPAEKEEKDMSGKWKCQCCETINDDSSAKCSLCMVDNPAKKVDTKAMFGCSATTKPEESKTDEKEAPKDKTEEKATSACAFGAPPPQEKTTMFAFGAPAAQPDKKEEEKPAFGFGIAPQPDGNTESKGPAFTFGFGAASQPDKEKKTEEPLPAFGFGTFQSGKKEETEEKSVFAFGTSPQPDKKKTEEKPAVGFGIGPQPVKDKTESKTTAPMVGFGNPLQTIDQAEAENKGIRGKWKCQCCETINDDSSARCTMCMVGNPTMNVNTQAMFASSAAAQPSKKEEGAPHFKLTANAATAGEATPVCFHEPVGDGWVCRACRVVNERDAVTCRNCCTIRMPPAASKKPEVPPSPKQKQHKAKKRPRDEDGGDEAGRASKAQRCWLCGVCGAYNEERNRYCKECFMDKAEDAPVVDHREPPPPRSEQPQPRGTGAPPVRRDLRLFLPSRLPRAYQPQLAWACRICGAMNPHTAVRCRSCLYRRP